MGGLEDDWICRDGEWVKHGVPSAPKPTEPCGPKKDCSAYNIQTCPSECAACPPCPECSSISCQSEAFCKSIGFDRDWHEDIQKRIDSFADCLAAGNPAMESYPRQCRAGDKVYIEEIGNELEKAGQIRISSPRPNQEIASPLIMAGEARGTWFFEGDFPVVLTNWDGLIIAEGYAQAQLGHDSEEDTGWMTEDFVQFKAELEFSKPEYNNKGTLILKKDNPSGLPENDDALEIPVFFK